MVNGKYNLHGKYKFLSVLPNITKPKIMNTFIMNLTHTSHFIHNYQRRLRPGSGIIPKTRNRTEVGRIALVLDPLIIPIKIPELG